MTTNLMTDFEVNEFLEYCHDICRQRKYASYLENHPVWNEEKERIYRFGTVAGLFYEANPFLINLLNKQCNHDELKCLLEHYRDEQENSELALLARKYNPENKLPEVEEPLIKWIYEVNYLLASPISGDYIHRDDKAFAEEPERILTCVYLNLKHREYERNHVPSIFKQENIENIYNGVFDKTSSYRTYGLIPIDTERTLHSFDEPVRIYDQEIDKTVFLLVSRPLAMVFQKLVDEKRIDEIAFRGDNWYIYEGENRRGSLMEAVEAGMIFDLEIASLPEMSKLVSDNSYNDSLWITVDDENITFEELCDDIIVEDDSVVTQVIHLQYSKKNITHIDHEYIFYSLEEYEERQCVRRKGEAGKRFKTFKVDKSAIPFNYACTMLSRDGEDISVPFIYFVLNTYFVHKDLLKEYFQRILKREG